MSIDNLLAHRQLPDGTREFREPHIAEFLIWHATATDSMKHDGAVLCGAGVHAWTVEPPEPNGLPTRWCSRCGIMQRNLPGDEKHWP